MEINRVLRAIIIDDEQGASRSLNSLIQIYASAEIEVVGFAINVTTALESIKREKPDLIFLDMDLKGENGLQVLEYFEKTPCQVIITTAYSEYALPSFQFGVADYLIKPISPAQLKRALARVQDQLLLLAQAKSALKPVLEQILIPFGYSNISVSVNNLIRMQANRNYTWVHVKEDTPILVSKNISKLAELVEPFEFIRVHHSHLVNPIFIQSLNKKSNYIELTEGTIIPVSRERKKSILAMEELIFINKK